MAKSAGFFRNLLRTPSSEPSAQPSAQLCRYPKIIGVEFAVGGIPTDGECSVLAENGVATSIVAPRICSSALFSIIQQSEWPRP